MINGKKWYAFFSHTGTEIYNLTRRVGITPDCVVTNTRDMDKLHPGLKKLSTEFRYTNNWPKEPDYDFMLDECETGCICTLHGWMRIVPPSVCESHEMYNLHPGLITRYPELVGKDPQDRVDPETHEYVGLVIHRVTEQLDGGEVIVEMSTRNNNTNTHKVLHDMALEAWDTLFHKVLFNKHNERHS